MKIDAYTDVVLTVRTVQDDAGDNLVTFTVGRDEIRLPPDDAITLAEMLVNAAKNVSGSRRAVCTRVRRHGGLPA